MSPRKNEECLLAILTKYKECSTKQIIDIANSQEFGDLCSGCQSGSDVIGIGRKLAEQGLISKELGKGGYVWRFVER